MAHCSSRFCREDGERPVGRLQQPPTLVSLGKLWEVPIRQPLGPAGSSQAVNRPTPRKAQWWREFWSQNAIRCAPQLGEYEEGSGAPFGSCSCGRLNYWPRPHVLVSHFLVSLSSCAPLPASSLAMFCANSTVSLLIMDRVASGDCVRYCVIVCGILWLCVVLCGCVYCVIVCGIV